MHLVGFIIKKFLTMHGHTNVKNFFMRSFFWVGGGWGVPVGRKKKTLLCDVQLFGGKDTINVFLLKRCHPFTDLCVSYLRKSSFKMSKFMIFPASVSSRFFAPLAYIVTLFNSGFLEL